MGEEVLRAIVQRAGTESNGCLASDRLAEVSQGLKKNVPVPKPGTRMSDTAHHESCKFVGLGDLGHET